MKVTRGDKNQIAICLGIAFGALCILSFFSIAVLIPTILVTPMMLCMISYYTKSIEMDQSGCKIKTFLLKQSFAWSDFCSNHPYAGFQSAIFVKEPDVLFF